MAYLIVILALGVIIAPLLAARPPPREREIARLRERARTQGLAVSLWEPPEVPPRFRFQRPHHLACYRLARAPAAPDIAPRGLFVRTDAGWQTREVGGAIPDLLTTLPEGAVIVLAGSDDVRVFWDERGGDAALDALTQALRTWIDVA